VRIAPDIDVLDQVDVVELGVRVAMGLHGENRGLAWGQRLPVITERRPPRRGWQLHYGDDGMASKMTWPAFDVAGSW
jgi:hypothetical protein